MDHSLEVDEDEAGDAEGDKREAVAHEVDAEGVVLGHARLVRPEQERLLRVQRLTHRVVRLQGPGAVRAAKPRRVRCKKNVGNTF